MQLPDPAAQTAFSNQSDQFDGLDAGNPLSAHLRSIVRASVDKHLPPHAEILELNCGTGLDAFYFTSQGHRVVATDAAPGMIDRLKVKIRLNPGVGIEPLVLSYHNIDELSGRTFDHVFSNFGGLNCTPDLADVLHKIPALLKKNGIATLVIMPRICPWELLMVLKGKFRTAFRRVSGKTVARVEGVPFYCYYYSPGYVKRHLRAQMEVVEIRGIYITVPPEFYAGFVERYPRLYRVLRRIDQAIGGTFPFNRCCDHFMITLRKRSG